MITEPSFARALEAHGTTQRIQSTVGRAEKPADVHWQYSLLSNRRFPFRFSASAMRGSGPEAEEVLVVALECFDASDATGQRLLVSADITGEEGLILAEGPRRAVELPSEDVLMSDPQGWMQALTKQVLEAADHDVRWLEEQGPLIEGALVRSIWGAGDVQQA
jgi:hypothetical protein